MRVSYAYQRVSPAMEDLSATCDVPDATALDMYRTMVLSRVFEERLREAYSDLEFKGELHLSMGHEAVAAGTVAAAGECFVTSHHRSHALAVAKGLDLRAVAAEIFGRATGLCRGKGGHMHLTDLSKGFVISGIVGASVPMGAGHAFASKALGKGTLTLAFTGDGAMHQGSVLETLNLASLWKVPILIVVENNRVAFSTPPSTHSSVEPLAARARGFGIESYAMDGTDATAVYGLASELARNVTSESRPVLVEFRVPRLSGHMEIVDFEDYLSEAEKEERVRRDPIPVTKAVLLRHGVLDEARDASIRSECEETVRDALEYARASPFPEADDALTDVG